MATRRFSHLDDFVLKDGKIGIGTSDPSVALEIIGALKATNIKSSGISTSVSQRGFISQDMGYLDNVTIDSGDSGTLSGEIVVGTGLTMTVSTGATTGQGGIDSMKVSNTFTPPIGRTVDRPTAPKPGALFYNKDFKTIEYWDGHFWRQVDYITTSGRGLFAGGRTPNFSATIGFINISSLGNSEYFGQLQTTRESISCNASSSTRGLFAGGYGPATVDTIGYVSIASRGNAADFGNLAAATYSSAGGGSSTRGIFGGGFTSPTQINVIQYVEIATTGNATNFGDLTVARRYPGSASSPIRCVFGGGADTSNPVGGFSTLDYIQIASKGDAKDFGNLSQITWFGQGSCSSSTRGLFHTCANSWSPGWATSTNVDSIEISSTGNGTGFGDLTLTRTYTGGVSNSVRACFGGGFHGPSTVRYNTIDYISISSGGNATDFGNLIESRTAPGTCSDSHGGLGGF